MEPVFEFVRVRLGFRAVDAVHFPPGMAGNTVRGTFGGLFRRIVCVPPCRDPKTCDRRASCAYARVFEPRAAGGAGPSGLADWPRPFVFRASHLAGMMEPGAAFSFDIHLFDTREPLLPYFVLTFAQLAREGIGPGRGKAELASADVLGLGGETFRAYDGETFVSAEAWPRVRIPLRGPAEAVRRCRLRFVTPTELKGAAPGRAPEFGVLFARLRDRVSTLRALYGGGPLEIDFRAMGERARAVRLAGAEVRMAEVERSSAKTGQRHPIGGLVGWAEYEGELGEFVPYLELGRWVGVGRHTVWGNGEVELMTPEARGGGDRAGLKPGTSQNV